MKWHPLNTERDFEIYAQVLEGNKTQAKIAEEYGIAPGRVSNIAKMVREWVAPHLAGKIDAIREAQTKRLLAEIEDLEAAWIRSQEDKVEITTEEVIIELITDGEKTEVPAKKVKTKVTGQVGDPRFKDLIIKAIDKISKLWGVEMPVKIAPTNAAGDGPARIQLVGLETREQLLNFQAFMERAQPSES